jgi:energy-coupling factor transport system permease protein
MPMKHFTVRETWLHRVNPSFKLAVCLVLFAIVLFTDRINFLVNLTWVSLLMFLFATGFPANMLLMFLLPVLLLLVSSSTSMMFFGKGETTWLQWGLLHITKESFFRGLHIGFKSVNFALLGYVLALTTKPVLLIYSLMQQCRLPAKYAYSFMAAVRLAPLVAEEFQTLRRALAVRGVEEQRGIRGFFAKLKAYSVPLLAQSIRRAQRMAVAMEAKRFSRSSARTYYYHVGFSLPDVWFALLWAVAIAAAHWAGTQYPYFDIMDVR